MSISNKKEASKIRQELSSEKVNEIFLGPKLITSQLSSKSMITGNQIIVQGFDDISINKAIETAISGDTIYFPSGTYKINSNINLKSGLSYQGSTIANNSGTILLSQIQGAIFSLTGSTTNIPNNVIINNIIFNGGGIIIAGVTSSESTPTNLDTTTMANNITITNCTFKNFNGQSSLGMLTILLVKNIIVSNNIFQNNQSNAIFGFHNKSLSIIKNSFQNNYECVYHGGVELNGGDNIIISYNTLIGTQRMGFEFQGYFPNLLISYNNLIKWAATPGKTPGQISSCAISVPGASPLVSINNNTISGFPENALGVGVEVVATNSLVENNKISYIGTAFLVGYCPNTLFQNNIISNLLPNLADTYTTGAFTKDGGYEQGENIGANTINGKVVIGTTWSF